MPRTKTADEALLAELTAVKRLLMFGLIRSGVTQRQLAAALGTSQSTISRMLPESSGKKAKSEQEED